MNRGSFEFSLNQLYSAIGLQRQGFTQWLNRQRTELEQMETLLPIIEQIREEYPTLAAREMYWMVNPPCGRDKFERFCFDNGYKVEKKISYHRTTNSLGVTRFMNLTIDIELSYINQLWVSDITYYRIANSFYYLTFIMDRYSRKIIGYSASRNLTTEDTTIPAIMMVLKERPWTKETIIHSDGGGQYYSKEFLHLTKGLRHSMGKTAYENPHAERINGIIKNDYLRFYAPQNFRELETELARAIWNYNRKPIKLLNRKSPLDFEQLLTTTNSMNRRKKGSKKEKSKSINLVL